MKNLLLFLKILIVEIPTEIWRSAVVIQKAKQKARKLKVAIKLADVMTKSDKRRRYVLNDWEGNPIPLTRMQVYALQRKNILSKNIKITDLYREALYIS